MGRPGLGALSKRLTGNSEQLSCIHTGQLVIFHCSNEPEEAKQAYVPMIGCGLGATQGVQYLDVAYRLWAVDVAKAQT